MVRFEVCLGLPDGSGRWLKSMKEVIDCLLPHDPMNILQVGGRVNASLGFTAYYLMLRDAGYVPNFRMVLQLTGATEAHILFPGGPQVRLISYEDLRSGGSSTPFKERVELEAMEHWHELSKRFPKKVVNPSSSGVGIEEGGVDRDKEESGAEDATEADRHTDGPEPGGGVDSGQDAPVVVESGRSPVQCGHGDAGDVGAVPELQGGAETPEDRPA